MSGVYRAQATRRWSIFGSRLRALKYRTENLDKQGVQEVEVGGGAITSPGEVTMPLRKNDFRQVGMGW